MPARFLAALDVLDLEPHHLAVEQADDRMQRPHPRGLARAPAHRLRPRKLRRHRRHHLGHDLLRRPAALLDPDDVEVALLLVLDDGGILDRREPRRFHEPRNRLLRRIHARALAFLGDVRRFRRHALHHQRQPPRRRERLGLARLQPLRLQAFGDQPPQILRRPPLHPRRDLLGKQLEQQFRHGGTPAEYSNCIPSGEAAEPRRCKLGPSFDRLRTRSVYAERVHHVPGI